MIDVRGNNPPVEITEGLLISAWITKEPAKSVDSVRATFAI
jgi:hypothetical protein